MQMAQAPEASPFGYRSHLFLHLATTDNNLIPPYSHGQYARQTKAFWLFLTATYAE